MKKKFQILIVAILLISINSCKEKGQEKTKPQAAGYPNEIAKKVPDSLIAAFATDCDYYVERTVADLMIDTYEKNFHVNGLVKEFWIEKCVLTGIATYLQAHPGADGVRFFLGAEQKSGASLTSKLQVVMTTPADPPTEYEKHLNEFGSPIPLSSCNPSAIDVNLPLNRAQEKIDTFGYRFRRERIFGQRSPAGKDQLSIGVWIARCKIDSLMTLFNDAGNNLDGLMAISAAYYAEDGRYRARYRKYIVQSTLIFVPTVGGVKNWEIVRPPEGKSGGGLNHGELCPTICD